MTDKEIKELFKIPTQTLHQWKNSDKDDWRIRFYKFFSLKDASEVKPDIERIEKILKTEQEPKI
jgi:hypothetical protein